MRTLGLVGVLLVIGLVSFAPLTSYVALGQQPAAVPPPVQPAPTNVFPSTAPVAYPPAAAYFAAVAGVSEKESELERQSQGLARQYGQAQNRDEREKLQKQLSDVLQQQFEAQQERRKKEIERIEDQMKKLRELMQKREDAKRTIIQRRLEQLLQDAEGLGWTTTEPGGRALTPTPAMRDYYAPSRTPRPN